MLKGLDGLKIKGHIGTWYVIDEMETKKHGAVYLLEHEEYGDEAACLIVDAGLNVIVEDVWNGFDDLDIPTTFTCCGCHQELPLDRYTDDSGSGPLCDECAARDYYRRGMASVM